MEYNSEKAMSFKTPHPDFKIKYLKIDMIRISVLREAVSSNRYYEILHKSITETRIIINKI